jgi:hypothetical protein
MITVPRPSIAALLVLTMFSTALGQFVDCSASCSANGCSIVSNAKACCGSCGNGGSCECKKSTARAAKKSCCDKSAVSTTRSCCSPKNDSNSAPASATRVAGCGKHCPCVSSTEFPPVPLEQPSKAAESLKLPVMNFGPVLAVLPTTDVSALGLYTLNDSPSPRAGNSLRIWICSWTT